MTRCPRCTGQMTKDLYEGICCLQCGYSPPPAATLPLINEPPGRQNNSKLIREDAIP